MEELAKLEVERGTPGYVQEGGNVKRSWEAVEGGAGKGGSMPDVSGVADGRKGKRERVASNEMCTFLILNISSLQLIPVNMIAYRSQYGSVNPAGIIAPAIVATFVSTLVAVVYCKVKNVRQKMRMIQYTRATDIFSDYNYSKVKDEIVEKYSLPEPVERGSHRCEDIVAILIGLDKVIDNFQGESAGIREELKSGIKIC